MKINFKNLLFASTILSICLFTPMPCFAQSDVVGQKVIAGDGAAGDRFGIGIHTTDKYAIIGAPYDDDGTSSGSAYIFERNGNVWSEMAKLTASDGAAEDKFGYSVALTNNYAIVGSAYDDDDGNMSGSAYIFQRKGNTWIEMAKLKANDADACDIFGISVSITNDYAIVGASLVEECSVSKTGGAYIFKRMGASWIQVAKLTNGEGDFHDGFGFPVALTNNYALVGAYAAEGNGDMQGAAHLFRRHGGTWTQLAKLQPDENAEFGFFGGPIAITDRYAVIGTKQWQGAPGTGAPYIFRRRQGAWVRETRLVDSSGSGSSEYGIAVSMAKDYVVVGDSMNNEFGSNFGAAYIFKRNRNDGTWLEKAKLASSDGISYENFGFSVAASKHYVTVGAWRAQDNGSDSGAAYFFKVD